jgi:vacuolar-type H+-ATPase subunit D/Vma8
MKKISLFKKIKLFREYKKIIKSKSSEIEQQFGARIDNAKRIYNVINVPVENIGELYDLYEVKKVEKYSYLVVIGFSLFKSHEYYNNIRWKLIPTSILVSLLISLFFLI